MGKIVAREDLANLHNSLKQQGKTIVSTNGCFDILHVGHVRALQQSKALGDILVVGINSDNSVKRLNKGPERPIIHEGERAELIASLGCVDYVTIFDEDTPVEFLQELKPDLHAKGSDYSPEQLAETPVVEKHGGKVKILELVPGHSTSSIVQRIKELG
jgi:rfaE bifunctional protein nucleotidyltransferase chain/domain